MLAGVLLGCSVCSAQEPNGSQSRAPKTWDEAALAEWATPLAGINVRPAHTSAREYYALPVDNLKTYPVYLAGREPEGYWEMLNAIGPKNMIEPEKLNTEADWIKAGQVVFEQMDHLHLRTFDKKFIEAARRGESAFRRADGTAANLRWVPTKDGVALSFPNCANCHVLTLGDGTTIPGAPQPAGTNVRTGPPGPPIISQVQMANHFTDGGVPIRMGSEPVGMWLYRAFSVPWVQNDIHEQLKGITEVEYRALFDAGLRGGALPRWNGSLYYPAKIPDLIGIKDRKYIDHTATHLNRGVGDLMRYAALVSTAEATVFGPHDMLPADAERPKARRSDEALYALSLYLQSLKPPPNPNPLDENAVSGAKIFQREGCAGCHVPPLYTNNKLTLAEGFEPPKNRPATLDILPLSVGTSSGLALKTRKGTGYYKVPSLKGVWYRGHYLHDGSVASLEEMFNPERLTEAHVPGGYSPPGVKNRAIAGHEFGLKLQPPERAQLIAFLRTL
jgi:Di-haem oxidoreductase, putative peroxidase